MLSRRMTGAAVSTNHVSSLRRARVTRTTPIRLITVSNPPVCRSLLTRPVRLIRTHGGVPYVSAGLTDEIHATRSRRSLRSFIASLPRAGFVLRISTVRFSALDQSGAHREREWPRAKNSFRLVPPARVGPGRLLKGHPKGLPVGGAADFSVEVASALAHAYGLGIVHRDLKPSNLFAQDDGPLKVLYFGISRDRNATSGPTCSGQALGTPFYMAPEQLRDAEPSLSASEMRLPRGFWRRSQAISDSNVGAS
jgi:hypothetical protein